MESLKIENSIQIENPESQNEHVLVEYLKANFDSIFIKNENPDLKFQ